MKPTTPRNAPSTHNTVTNMHAVTHAATTPYPMMPMIVSETLIVFTATPRGALS